ncbi:MAG: nucleoside deaminase [Ilumatobacter sp.]|uniref:nucleoside deaminase n=1 Tax=Ilumatobacter sp. TaxID=1967498 RepID=UPI003C784A60
MTGLTIAALYLPWRRAFDEAWQSFKRGSFGIGAVLVDPFDGAIVTSGRNRVAERAAEPRLLSGNLMAHAEMNAFAALDRPNADGLHLYTTLEPCLMCAATAMQLKTAHVHFAAIDEFYVGMNEVWSEYTLTAERQPDRTGPLPDHLARFARLLPLVFTLRHTAGRSAEQLARRHHPELSARADALRTDDEFRLIVESGTVDDAAAHLDL